MWMIANIVDLFIGFGGLFIAMSNAVKPPAPIIITIPLPAIPAPRPD